MSVLPPEWSEKKSKSWNGRTFYFNKLTKETRWERPHCGIADDDYPELLPSSPKSALLPPKPQLVPSAPKPPGKKRRLPSDDRIKDSEQKKDSNKIRKKANEKPSTAELLAKGKEKKRRGKSTNLKAVQSFLVKERSYLPPNAQNKIACKEETDVSSTLKELNRFLQEQETPASSLSPCPSPRTPAVSSVTPHAFSLTRYPSPRTPAISSKTSSQTSASRGEEPSASTNLQQLNKFLHEQRKSDEASGSRKTEVRTPVISKLRPTKGARSTKTERPTPYSKEIKTSVKTLKIPKMKPVEAATPARPSKPSPLSTNPPTTSQPPDTPVISRKRELPESGSSDKRRKALGHQPTSEDLADAPTNKGSDFSPSSLISKVVSSSWDFLTKTFSSKLPNKDQPAQTTGSAEYSDEEMEVDSVVATVSEIRQSLHSLPAGASDNSQSQHILPPKQGISAESANRIPSTDPSWDLEDADGRILYLVLDTNVLIKDLGFVEDLLASVPGESSEVTIPWVVLQELDGLKSDGRIGRAARKATDFLHSRREEMVFEHNRDNWTETPDDRLLDCLHWTTERGTTGKGILLSLDKNLCLKSEVEGYAALTTLQFLDAGMCIAPVSGPCDSGILFLEDVSLTASWCADVRAREIGIDRIRIDTQLCFNNPHCNTLKSNRLILFLSSKF